MSMLNCHTKVNKNTFASLGIISADERKQLHDSVFTFVTLRKERSENWTQARLLFYAWSSISRRAHCPQTICGYSCGSPLTLGPYNIITYTKVCEIHKEQYGKQVQIHVLRSNNLKRNWYSQQNLLTWGMTVGWQCEGRLRGKFLK
jgi:hypothetical protein